MNTGLFAVGSGLLAGAFRRRWHVHAGIVVTEISDCFGGFHVFFRLIFAIVTLSRCGCQEGYNRWPTARRDWQVTAESFAVLNFGNFGNCGNFGNLFRCPGDPIAEKVIAGGENEAFP